MVVKERFSSIPPVFVHLSMHTASDEKNWRRSGNEITIEGENNLGKVHTVGLLKYVREELVKFVWASN